MTFFIAGNSHCIALSQGLKLLNRPDNNPKVFSFGSGVHETTEFSAVGEDNRVRMIEQPYKSSLRTATGKDSFDPADVWGIVMGTHNARIHRNNIWKSSAPSVLRIAGARPISLGTVDAMILQDQMHVRSFLSRLKASGVSVFVISCPWARRDGQAAQQGTPLPIIRWLDDRARRAFMDFLDDEGIPFIPPPPGTRDEDGFLKLEYSQLTLEDGRPDPHHGNAEYGRLMMTAVLETMDTVTA